MKLLACFLAPVLLMGAASPKITYVKSFPKSAPEYMSIEVARDGSTLYKEALNDENPVNFVLSKEDTDHIFELAEKLDHFKKPLESGLKVAFMGDKILRYEDGDVKSETKFNYSIEDDARLLQDWFERISETQQYLFRLDSSVRFDKLGVNNCLLQIQAALDRNRIVGRERFLPLLDRVAKNESFLHMARERAAALADALRNPVAAIEKSKTP